MVKKKKNPNNLLEVSSRTVRKIIGRLKIGCSNCSWNLVGLDIHHIIPKSKGGSNNNDNLTVLCPNCYRLSHSGILTTMISFRDQVGDRWKEHYYSLKE